VFKPFETTGIGSLPFTDPEEAVKLVLEGCDIPFWPQLPKRSFKEYMIPQYCEGFPCIEVDEEKKQVSLKATTQEDLNAFYEAISKGEAFPISGDFAAGFYAFKEALKKGSTYAIKGQITGPLTFSLGLKDPEGRYLYFNEELREIALMLLSAKARWQIEVLKEYAEQVIMFIDEPILSALGSSSYLGVSTDEAGRMLKTLVEEIHSAGAISGIHCCGKADWALVIETGVKILNFDAFDYFDAFNAYSGEIASFVQRGGLIAWGIIPTTDAINTTSLDKLKEKLTGQIETLGRVLPVDTIKSHSLLTPSCGAGSRTVQEARRVFQLLVSLKEAMLS